MEFEIDRETFNDLEIFSNNWGEDGIRRLFKNTRTIGARDLLQKMMVEPHADIEILTERLEIIKYFRDSDLTLDLNHNQVDLIEHYLKFSKRFLRNNPLDALYDHFKNKINISPAYYVVTEGISNILRLMKVAKSVIDHSQDLKFIPKALRKESRPTLLDDNFLVRLMEQKQKLSCFEINKLDRYLRTTKLEDVKQLLEFIYKLDVYESAGIVARKPGWSLPNFEIRGTKLVLNGLFHPDIKNPVLNDITVDDNQSLIFLTGPNMAGKSSFLKSLGLSVYLAHIGFPVPASKMQTPVFKGLITTINLADNISEGLSHYYSEIKRIKYTALKIMEQGSLFVIFDELFRGTNPRDAVDASLLIVRALMKIPNCIFMISTHHADLAEEIESNTEVCFKYLESTFSEGIPEFSYKLQNGVSHNRTGIYILRSEGVLDLLDQAVQKGGTGANRTS